MYTASTPSLCNEENLESYVKQILMLKEQDKNQPSSSDRADHIQNSYRLIRVTGCCVGTNQWA